jgi:tRNA threonylcarbamoyl adenosine modification protein (Sua5/YciO/YrdC/YwlC family)
MKRLIPGPYTFLLPATKLVPKVVMNPKRKTTGIRVPDSPVCQQLIEILDNPIISASAHLPDEEEESAVIELEKAKLFDALENQVDIIIDDEREPGFQVSTILDLTTDEPAIVRKGLGWEDAENWLVAA